MFTQSNDVYESFRHVKYSLKIRDLQYLVLSQWQQFDTQYYMEDHVLMFYIKFLYLPFLRFININCHLMKLIYTSIYLIQSFIFQWYILSISMYLYLRECTDLWFIYIVYKMSNMRLKDTPGYFLHRNSTHVFVFTPHLKHSAHLHLTFLLHC